MVIGRGATLGVEVVLVSATAIAYAAMIVGGTRAARVSWAAARWGGVLAAVAALLTIRSDAIWLFDAIRISTGTQAIKILIGAGLALSTLVVAPDARERERCVGPVFRLIAALGLVLTASAADLVVLWLGLEIASIAFVVAAALGGRWSDRLPAIRSLVVTWLPTSVVWLLAAIVLGAIAGGTRYADLEVMLPDLWSDPAVIVSLLVLAGALLVRAARFAMILGRL